MKGKEKPRRGERAIPTEVAVYVVRQQVYVVCRAVLWQALLKKI